MAFSSHSIAYAFTDVPLWEVYLIKAYFAAIGIRCGLWDLLQQVVETNIPQLRPEDAVLRHAGSYEAFRRTLSIFRKLRVLSFDK